MRRLSMFLGSLLFVVNLADKAFSQQTAEVIKKIAIVNSCESNIARIDYLHGQAGNERSIIVIARLGDGEKSRVLNQRRLHNIHTYLVRFLGRDPQTVITAQGERAKGKGRIEIYVGGELADAFGVGRGEDIYVGSCEDATESDKLLFDSRRRLSMKIIK